MQEGLDVINKDIEQDLCQISLTGTRSLVLLGLLIQAPRSLEEIREEFIKFNIMKEYHSNDILRIDLNTLRSIGCDITRADKKTNNKYVLLKHPFNLNITQEEVKLLKRALNKVKEHADLEHMMKYHELFCKIAEHISDKDIKEQIIGLSPLRKYSMEKINELVFYCKHKKELKLSYQPPAINNPIEMNIYTQKLVFKNDKIYLYGFDTSKNEAVTLNIKCILNILGCKDCDNNTTTPTPITVKFKLTNFGVSGLDENENILEGNAEKGFLVEGKYHNTFTAVQRILSFGSACTVIEPEEFKTNIIQILKKMRNLYNG